MQIWVDVREGTEYNFTVSIRRPESLLALVLIEKAGGNNMKIYDAVNKTEVEVDGTKGLIQIMKDGRQVDIYLKEKKSDEDGYMSWDVEHWSSVDGKRFIRCYSLEGRVLGESTGHNIYDLQNEFKPEDEAMVEKVELS